MTHVVLSRVSYAQTDSVPLMDSVPLIRDLSLRLEAGWTGIVGADGAGKTTLLRLLTGELAPETGAVHAHPPSLRARLCPQTVEEVRPDVCALAEQDQGQEAADGDQRGGEDVTRGAEKRPRIRRPPRTGHRAFRVDYRGLGHRHGGS